MKSMSCVRTTQYLIHRMLAQGLPIPVMTGFLARDLGIENELETIAIGPT